MHNNTLVIDKSATGRSVITTGQCAATVGSISAKTTAPTVTTLPKTRNAVNAKPKNNNPLNRYIARRTRDCMMSASFCSYIVSSTNRRSAFLSCKRPGSINRKTLRGAARTSDNQGNSQRQKGTPIVKPVHAAYRTSVYLEGIHRNIQVD